MTVAVHIRVLLSDGKLRCCQVKLMSRVPADGWLPTKQTATRYTTADIPSLKQDVLQRSRRIEGPDLLASCCCWVVVAVDVQVEGPAGAVREGSPS